MHIYMSYAREDAAYGERLQLLLKPLYKDFGFTTWSRHEIAPGCAWQMEMARHLKGASLFVPMVSADYIASSRCAAETTAALRLEHLGQIKIVGILLRPTYMEFSPLEHALLLPDQNKPITRWRNQDEAWIQVQRGILDVIKRLQIQ